MASHSQKVAELEGAMINQDMGVVPPTFQVVYSATFWKNIKGFLLQRSVLFFHLQGSQNVFLNSIWHIPYGLTGTGICPYIYHKFQPNVGIRYFNTWIHRV